MTALQQRALREQQLARWQFMSRDGRVYSCAWCQRDLGVRPSAGESHGICPRHAAAELRAIGIELQRDGDGLALMEFAGTGLAAAAGDERQVVATAPEAAAASPAWKEAA